MKTVFVCYTCDNWHTPISHESFAIASDLPTAILLCEQMAKSEGEKISDDDRSLLWSIKQTQNYTGEGEFIIEERDVDKLFWHRKRS